MMTLSSLHKRVISSFLMFVIITLVISAFYLVPTQHKMFIPIVVTCILVCKLAQEWTNLVPAINQGLRYSWWRWPILLLPVISVMIYCNFLRQQEFELSLYLNVFLVFCCGVYVGKCFARKSRMLPSFDGKTLRSLPQSLHQWDVACFGILYTFLSGVGLMNFWQTEHGSLLVSFLLICVSLADSAAYFGGRKWGKKKMSPVISPGKTWAGFYSGLFSVVFFSVIFALVLEEFKIAFPTHILFFVPVIVLLSVWGDLFISLLKRRSGLKDVTNFIPGHGGLLDRLDSHMMVFAFLSPLPLIILR